MSVARRVGIAAGTLGRRRRARVRRAAARRDPDAARARRRRARARSTRPMYVDHRLDDARRRHDLRRRAGQRARPADRPLARRHPLGAHVVPSARGAPEGGLPRDRVRPSRSRPVGARRQRVTRSRTSVATCKTVLEGLDLRGAVLVGHSMGGVAVQSFVTRFPEVAAERVAGIVLLSTLAYTPFGSRSTRTKARLEQITKRAPDAQWLWDVAEPRASSRRASASARTRSPSHVELVRQMMARVPARDPARRAARARRSRPHRATSRTCASRRWSIGGTADVLTPPVRGAAHRAAHPRRAARAVAGRRAHADARAHRRARPAHRRLRPRGARRGDLTGSRATTARARRCPRVELRDRGSARRPRDRGRHRRDGDAVARRARSVRARCAAARPRRARSTLLEPGAHRRARRRGRARGRLGVRAGGGRRRDAVPRRARARASRPRADRCRSCPPRASSTSSRRGGRRPGADDGYAAAVAAARDEPLETGRVGAGAGRDGRQVARARAARCRAASASPSTTVDDVARRRARGRQRGRRRDRAPTARCSRARPRRPSAPGFPTPAPFEEDRANTTLVVVVTDAALDKVGVSPARAERARRLRAGAAPGAHALRRRHRLRGRDRHRDAAGRAEPRPAAGRGGRRGRRGDSHALPVASRPVASRVSSLGVP